VLERRRQFEHETVKRKRARVMQAALKRASSPGGFSRLTTAHGSHIEFENHFHYQLHTAQPSLDPP
jgi:hypothetical protein